MIESTGLENMEKRSASKNGNRSSTATQPGSNGEKQKQDSGNTYGNKSGKGSARRREPPAAPRSRPAEYRKSSAQKSNSFDKRPRPRGNNHGDNRYRHSENTQAYSMASGESFPDLAETGSVQRPGSKKQNLNHLLNFTLAPREQSARGGWRWGNTNTRGGWQRRSSAYNKEQYLQANCQFIVADNQDYSVHARDPDLLVDWKQVELVKIYVHETPSCPICLHHPTVGKITRCGHIYCWSCILHYLALGEKTWRKCPICYESVHAQDLKSVHLERTYEHCLFKDITFQLMCRHKGSTIIRPLTDTTTPNTRQTNMIPTLGDDEVSDRYSKILISHVEQMEQVREQEKVKLKEQLVIEEESEKCFIEQALAKLQEESGEHKMSVSWSQGVSADDNEVSACKVFTYDTPVGFNPVVEQEGGHDWFGDDEDVGATAADITGVAMETMDGEHPDGRDEVDGDVELVAEMLEGGGEIEVGGEEVEVGGEEVEVGGEEIEVGDGDEVEVLASSNMHTATCRTSNRDVYYFYQAADGQHIYLHALNVRCLVKEYGCLERCPPTITATLIQLDPCSMTQDLRKRLRYLGHLPITCEFQVAELRLQAPLVTIETLKFFHVELQKRREMRQKRKHTEREWNRRARLEENKRSGKFPAARHNLHSDREFPRHSQSVTEGTSTSSAVEIPADDTTSSVSTPQSLSPAEAYVGRDSVAPSFAQMLQASKSISTAPAWPRAAGTTCAAAAASKGVGDSDEEVLAPQYHDSFSQAFQNAIDNMKISKTKVGEDDKVQVDVAVGSGGGKKGKKKNKQKLLFSTSMARSK